LGVPGQQVGGMPGQETSTYQLPLNLLILGIQMNGSSLRVHLQVTNTGRSAFPVPSCTDQQKAHLGKKKRRSFEFGFEFTEGERRISEIADVTFASDSSTCSTNLQAGGSVVVIVNVRIPSEFRNVVDRARLQAICREITLEDQRFYVAAISDPVRSPATPLR
jgi:hypothetical protein